MSNIKLTKQPPKTVRYGVRATPYGKVLIGLTEEGALCRLHFMAERKQATEMNDLRRAWPRTNFIEDKKTTAAMAKKLFGKNAKASGLKIRLVGTPFQQQVWKALIKIPGGKTISYAAIARQIKNPKAVRAVGGAVGANPVPILIPCHRVIASNGTIGGYSGGLAIKKKLLKAENIKISKS